MAWRNNPSNCGDRDNKTSSNSISKLIWIFIVLSLIDLILTLIGLIKGNASGYNIIAVTIFKEIGILGYVGFKLISIIIIYVLYKKLTKIPQIWITIFLGLVYINTILYDLKVLGFDMWVFPYWKIPYSEYLINPILKTLF